MIINGQLSEYECKFQRVGYTYAEIVVNETKENTVKFFFGLFSDTRVRQVKVWETTSSGRFGTLRYDELSKMHPDELRKHFKAAVKEYEEYTIAWAKEYDTIDVTMAEHESIIPKTGRLR